MTPKRDVPDAKEGSTQTKSFTQQGGHTTRSVQNVQAVPASWTSTPSLMGRTKIFTVKAAMVGNSELQDFGGFCPGQIIIKSKASFKVALFKSSWTDESSNIAARPSSEIKMITTDDDKLACIR